MEFLVEFVLNFDRGSDISTTMGVCEFVAWGKVLWQYSGQLFNLTSR